MKPKYNEAFREQAVQKLLQRGDKTISCIAEELNINVFTLRNWLKQYRPHTMSEHKSTKRPIDWTPEERLQALMASHGLKEEDLNAFCRAQGVFPHHLKAWRQAFINGTHPVAPQAPSDKSLRDENKQLKKDLNRKEKALAEAAALLVLQKKFQAFWEEKAS